MASLEEFLNKVVPDVLKIEQDKYPFMVVGTRSVKAFVARTTSANMDDWDVAYIGKEDGQHAFALDVKREMEKLGYTIQMELHKASGENDSDTYALKSRSWIRLTVDIGGDANITFLDIYRIPVLIPSSDMQVEYDGLMYSDLGFLTRELNRAEKDAENMVARAIKLSPEKIRTKIETVKDMLGNCGVDLDIIDQATDELIESLGQVSDDDAKQAINNQIRHLNEAKDILQRVAKEREDIFGALLSGAVSKAMSEQICALARELERQYVLYQLLKDRCADINASLI